MKKDFKFNWIRENVNPEGRKTGDCVIRAVAVATGQTWHEAFDGLACVAREMCYPMGVPETVDIYLISLGFKKVSLKVVKGERRKTVRELAMECTSPAVLRAANHMVAADGKGNYVDTWCSGSKAVYCYWIKK
jgi:hypothetical protein